MKWTDYGLLGSERLTLVRIGESGRIYRGFLDPKSGKPSAEWRGHHQSVRMTKKKAGKTHCWASDNKENG
jgi:hypothetical protein